MTTLSPVRHERTPRAPALEHEYAKLFPMLEGEAKDRLFADIKANGVIEPIVFLDGCVLDGRNRYYAAREAGIEYPRVDFLSGDPLAFVISRNMHRRHLTESQRAAAAAKIAKLPPHRPEKGANLHPSVEQAASMMNVSERSVQTAKKVIETGAPSLVAAVDAGKISVSAAAEVASLPREEQEEVIAHGEDAILDEAKRIKEKRRQERLAKQREHDAAREQARSALPATIRRGEEAKARNGSHHAAVAGKAPDEHPDAIKAERDELREENAALKADIAERDKRIAMFDAMAVQYEQGGFESVIATLEERIRGLKRQVEDISADRAKALKSRDFWREKAAELGYVSPNVKEIEREPAKTPHDDLLAQEAGF